MHLRVPSKTTRVAAMVAFTTLIGVPVAMWAPFAQASTGGAGTTAASGALAPAVDKAATTVTLNSNTNPSVYNQSGSVRATVKPVDPSTEFPTGTVKFTVDGVDRAPVTLSAGKAKLSLATLSVGTHNITATYSGDGTFAGSTTSTPFTQTVDKAATTVTLVSNTNPSVYMQWGSVRATVKVPPPSQGTPSGSVKFTVDGVDRAPVPLSAGVARLSLATLAVGTHNITATYLGDASYAASSEGALPQTVTKAATAVTLSTPANPAKLDAKGAIRARVIVVLPGGGAATGNVKFRVDGVDRAPVPLSAGIARLYLKDLTVGTHSIVVTYLGDASYLGSTSSTLTQTIN